MEKVQKVRKKVVNEIKIRPTGFTAISILSWGNVSFSSAKRLKGKMFLCWRHGLNYYVLVALTDINA